MVKILPEGRSTPAEAWISGPFSLRFKFQNLSCNSFLKIPMSLVSNATPFPIEKVMRDFVTIAETSSGKEIVVVVSVKRSTGSRKRSTGWYRIHKNVF